MKIYELEDEVAVLYTSVDCHEILPEKGYVRTNWEYVAFFAKPLEDGIVLTYISSRRPASGKAMFANYNKFHWNTGRVLIDLKAFLESLRPK